MTMLLRVLIWIVAIGLVGLVLSQLAVLAYSRTRIVPPGDVPAGKYRAAVVFGAGLSRDGSPSQILRDRVQTAADLYFAGKVEKLLMSGDNRFLDYNEPGSMQAYAIRLGIPEEDIVLDYAGRRTYDTCYRARAIFGLKEAILVTQDFHLSRAVFLCNTLGLPAIGVPADQRSYNWIWAAREIPARSIAIWEVFFAHPLPVLGNPEPIFPNELGKIFTTEPTEKN